MLVGDDKGNEGEIIHNKVKQLGLQETVKFLGVRSDVNELMQAMDVFLFPSLFEGFGIVALEAQAAGLPTIVSNRIPVECKVTKFIEAIDLSKSAGIWAEHIIQSAKKDRDNTYKQIKMAGFDIKENTRWLEEFYIDCYEHEEK